MRTYTKRSNEVQEEEIAFYDEDGEIDVDAIMRQMAERSNREIERWMAHGEDSATAASLVSRGQYAPGA